MVMMLLPPLLMLMPSAPYVAWLLPTVSVTVVPPPPKMLKFWVSPALTLLNSGLSANWICKLPLPSTTVWTFLLLYVPPTAVSLFAAIPDTALFAPMIEKLVPNALSVVPLLPVKFKPKLVKLLPNLNNWSPLTASCEPKPTVPPVTPLKVLPPKLTLSPAMVTVLPPLLMFRPPFSITTLLPLAVSPITNPSNSGRSANWICKLPLPSTTVFMFLPL